MQPSVGIVVPKDGPAKTVRLACCLMLQYLQVASLAVGMFTSELAVGVSAYT